MLIREDKGKKTGQLRLLATPLYNPRPRHPVPESCFFRRGDDQHDAEDVEGGKAVDDAEG